jgi:hypothetical protein
MARREDAQGQIRMLSGRQELSADTWAPDAGLRALADEVGEPLDTRQRCSTS